MDKQDQPKCFCARCFLPIDPEDKVNIDGQNFHRMCSTCCVCRTIPTSLKMFYGHVFCNDCFKTHVVSRFRGDAPRVHTNSWWMQWAPTPGSNIPDNKDEEEQSKQQDSTGEEPPKRCICARCLQMVDEGDKVDIGGQSFHPQCARCYFCHAVPTNNVKIYYGQVFCEDCFHRHVLNRNKDNPSEFFKSCFEQWQNNAQFSNNMKEFMAGKDQSPLIFMMGQPTFCKCGTSNDEWMQGEPKKSETAAASLAESSLGTWELSAERRTSASDSGESANLENYNVTTSEKIEKLTKYLHEIGEKRTKKWQNYIVPYRSDPTCCGWVDLQDQRYRSESDCPKCLWQCGPIYVNSDYLQKEVCCGEYSFQ